MVLRMTEEQGMHCQASLASDETTLEYILLNCEITVTVSLQGSWKQRQVYVSQERYARLSPLPCSALQ